MVFETLFTFLAIVVGFATIGTAFVVFVVLMGEGIHNRRELRHGSVLSPNTHPSLTEKQQDHLEQLNQDLAARIAAVKEEYVEYRSTVLG